MYLARCCLLFFFFFFNDTATTEIYTLSLHDALPISSREIRRSHHGRGPHHPPGALRRVPCCVSRRRGRASGPRDRKSTRLNSSHNQKSYAVFFFKKKKKKKKSKQITK